MGKRRNLDLYETAPWQTRALLKCHGTVGGRIFEPCVGPGALLRVMCDQLAREARVREFATNDIDKRHVADYHRDATKKAAWQFFASRHEFDWIVTNPPWSAALEIAQHARGYFPNAGLAMLVRRSWLEPTKERGWWLARNPPQRCLVLPRYSYTGGTETGTDLLGEYERDVKGQQDSVTSEWLIWTPTGEGIKYPPIFIVEDAKSL